MLSQGAQQPGQPLLGHFILRQEGKAVPVILIGEVGDRNPFPGQLYGQALYSPDHNGGRERWVIPQYLLKQRIAGRCSHHPGLLSG